MWHASVATYALDKALARELAMRALSGVGDSSLGEWHQDRPIAYHIRRRLSGQECIAGGKLVMRDIRGTDEERKRLVVVYREAPQLKAVFERSE